MSNEVGDKQGELAYALVAPSADLVDAPALPYFPPVPHDRNIPIGLIGAGGISFAHLDAYRTYGLNVVAICDRHLNRAIARRDKYFPQAMVTDQTADIIGNPKIAVVDLTLHPEARAPLMRQALEARQHVLSQKPFVRDLRTGKELVRLAETQGVQLAVNQNGRWAPHLSWMREAVLAGHVGEVTSLHVNIQWDHSWVTGTPFDQLGSVVLEDFAIHWFDFVASIVGDRIEGVFAETGKASRQTPNSALLAQALVHFRGGQASLVFDGNARFGAQDTTTIVGTEGTLRSTGSDLGKQQVELTTARGRAVPILQGQWFNDGFAGTMGALLSAVETGTEPLNSARGNLASLRLLFAALQSAGSSTFCSLD